MGVLEGHVAIVTGGASGLGLGIVQRYALEGAKVVVADIGGDQADIEALPGEGHRLQRLDVRSAAEFDSLVERTMSDYGRLDIIVNNAGVMDRGNDVADLVEDEYDRVFDVNVRGVLNGSRAAARVFRDQDRGRIINTASYIGKKAIAGHSLYAASKAAVISVTQSLALELGSFGTTANSICPGTMFTPMWVSNLGSFTGEENPDVEARRRENDARIPVGRMGTATDVGAMATWLASDDAQFVTGAALNLTGGEAVFF